MSARKAFANSVIPLAASPSGHAGRGLEMRVQAAQPDYAKRMFHLHFALAPAPALLNQLEERVAAGECIPLDAQYRQYGVDQANAVALRDWLRNEGFDIRHVTPGFDSIYAQASAAQIERSLQVHMVQVSVDGSSHIAASDAPSLPEAVAGSVFHIGGLQPFLRARKPRRFSQFSAASLGAERPAIDNAAPYLVAEIRKAYGADQLGTNGAGQEIAILIDTVPLDSDLAAFWTLNAAPADLARVEKINVAGTALPVPEGEETLDVCWTSGIASAANIRVYATGSLEFAALDRGLDSILADVAQRPGLRQVSISMGVGEDALGEASGLLAAQHLKFLRLAGAGVNVFVSSGDSGSRSAADGGGAPGAALTQTEYPASDPCVVAVGGTSLKLSSDGQVLSETAWSGSGGGSSTHFNRPSWQQGSGVVAGTRRLVPDVALAADPDQGAVLVLNGKRCQIGGTSWSAPVWAAFCALINALRLGKGQSALPFLNPLLYAQAGTGFRDIVQGSNGNYQAQPGYDMVTGLGVPKVQTLASALLQTPAPGANPPVTSPPEKSPPVKSPSGKAPHDKAPHDKAPRGKAPR